jgi:plastocyanin
MKAPIVVIGALLAALAFAPSTAGQYGPYPPTSGSPPSGTRHTVHIKGTSSGGFRFSPRKLTIKRRHTVRWSWQSDAPHNVTFRALGKHSKTRTSGSYKLKFSKAGTYRYLCTIHGFTGKVIVK